MRHHFTSSERLALQIMADLWVGFTDMETRPIRRDHWNPCSKSGTRSRRVSRVVTFTVSDSMFPNHRETKIFLEGEETETKVGKAVLRETTWRVSRVMDGLQPPYKEPIAWEETDLQDGFPRHLLRNTTPVLSTDA